MIAAARRHRLAPAFVQRHSPAAAPSSGTDAAAHTPRQPAVPAGRPANRRSCPGARAMRSVSGSSQSGARPAVHSNASNGSRPADAGRDRSTSPKLMDSPIPFLHLQRHFATRRRPIAQGPPAIRQQSRTARASLFTHRANPASQRPGGAPLGGAPGSSQPAKPARTTACPPRHLRRIGRQRGRFQKRKGRSVAQSAPANAATPSGASCRKPARMRSRAMGKASTGASAAARPLSEASSRG